jgi:hypothetical protein
MIAAAVLFLFCLLLSAVAISVFWFFQIRFSGTVDLNPDSIIVRLFARLAVGTPTDGPTVDSPSQETDTIEPPSELEGKTGQEFLEYSCGLDTSVHLPEPWGQREAPVQWWNLYNNPARLYAFHHTVKPRHVVFWSPTVVPCFRAGAESEKLSKPDVTELALLIKKEFDNINRRLDVIEDVQSTQKLLPFDLSDAPKDRSEPVLPN